MSLDPSGGSQRREDLSIDAKLRVAFELSPTVLAITSFDSGEFVEVNDAFTHVHGYGRDEVVGRTVSELDLWVDPKQRREAITAIMGGHPVRNFEARMRTKHGGERVCILNADLVVIDGRRCILTALTDITDRVQTEDALRESERRFLLAFHANPLPMSITRLDDDRHLEVNEAAVRHFGSTRAEMLGRTKAELGFCLSSEQCEAMDRELRDRGHIRDLEVTFQTRAAARRQLLLNAQVMTFGGVPAVLSVCVDLTDRVELEAETRARREEAEALAESLRRADRAKDEFLAMLGHELRNPLGTIRTAMALLERSARDERDRHVIDVVSRQTAQLARLVDDLLDMSRLTSGKIRLHLESTDLHALAHRCLDAFAHSGRTAAHHVTVEGENVHVRADVARMEQVVNNLLDNALKYTPADGRIFVSTAQVDGDAVLRVRDTGKGIDPSLLSRVFDYFMQEPQAIDRAQGGLGLGLAVVKGLVELHGGSVIAHSSGADRGSEFTVRLPATAPPASVAEPAPDRGGPQRRVLVVEDHDDAREMLQILLAMSGHVVDTAADGPSGFSKLQSFRPDVALIDLGLPGIDGYGLARMAREAAATRDIRLIALTGYGQMEDRQRAISAGFDRHVTKPVDPALLEQIVSESPARPPATG